MAKLYFRYGVMGSSKTANALMARFNYMEKGYKVWLIKPAIDTRDDRVDESGNRITIIKSRIGLEAEATVINHGDDIIAMFKKTNADAIVVDECQFLEPDMIDALKTISVDYNKPVLCYGLLTDFKTQLFPGSKRLVELANEIERVRHICKCGEGAQVNARLTKAGKVVLCGAQVEIGGNERYEAMCWRCWRDKINAQKVEVEL